MTETKFWKYLQMMYGNKSYWFFFIEDEISSAFLLVCKNMLLVETQGSCEVYVQRQILGLTSEET